MSEPVELKVYSMEPGYQERAGRPVKADWYVPPLGVLPSLAQGFVACLGSADNPMASFYAFPYRRKFWPGEIRVLRAARPMLSRQGRWEPFTARNLLLALRLVVRAFGLNMVELEVYREVWGPVFFPSSPTAIDACNDPELFKALALRGPASARVASTLELRLDEVHGAERGESDLPQGVVVRPIRRRHPDDRLAYYRLWSESGVLPLNPTGNAPRFGSWLELRPWYDDVSSLLSCEDFILFAEMNGLPVGFVHWWPNLYRIAERHGRGIMTVPASEAPALTREAGEARVFKLAISPKAGGNRGPVARALLLRALRVMAGDYGVRRVQVSVRPQDQGLALWLRGLGAETVHEIALLSVRA